MNNITKIKARIQWEIDAGHPDVGYVSGGWHEGEVFTYEDTYHFNNDMWNDYDSMVEYIDHDLRLIAGGGYSTDHIHNVKIKTTRIQGAYA